MATASTVAFASTSPEPCEPPATPRSRDCLHLVLEPVHGGEQLAATATAALGALATLAAGEVVGAGTPCRGPRGPIQFTNPNLVADLRRARAERFHSLYEQLSLRRRRAQIAARRMVE